MHGHIFMAIHLSSIILWHVDCKCIISTYSEFRYIQMISDAVCFECQEQKRSETVRNAPHRPRSKSPGNCIGYDPVGWEVVSQLLGCHILHKLHKLVASRNIQKYPECVVGHRPLHGPGTKWLFLRFERFWRVGVGWGMLTFLVSGTHVGCYVTEGVGWGMLTFLVSGTHVGCYVTEGLGWGGACWRSL